jgi:hypothetical protein
MGADSPATADSTSPQRRSAVRAATKASAVLCVLRGLMPFSTAEGAENLSKQTRSCDLAKHYSGQEKKDPVADCNYHHSAITRQVVVIHIGHGKLFRISIHSIIERPS